MHLYELTDNYKKVMDMLEDDEINVDVIKGTLESIECAIEVKAHNTVALVKSLEMYSKGIEAEINRLEAKKKAVDNKQESLKSYLFGQLETAKLTEVKTQLFSIKQQNGNPLVEIENEKLIPAKYKTAVPASFTIRKKEIAADLKAGKKVLGAKLVKTTSWRIR